MSSAKNKTNHNSYGKFAGVYDHLNSDLHSVQMAQKTFNLMDQFGIEVESCLDLCCGTGTAVKIFSEAGFNTDGLDGSAAMLKIARAKLKKEKKENKYKPKLYCQMLPKFQIPEQRGNRKTEKTKKYDLITSFFDSLNYLLTTKDLEAAFRSVNQHMNSGGYFIFDMNTPHALKHTWSGDTLADVKDDIGIIWRSSYDPLSKSATLLATFFVKEGRHWIRFDEEHIEAGYSNAEIKRLLRDSGFRVRGLYDFKTMDRPNRETNRIVVVAQKIFLNKY